MDKRKLTIEEMRDLAKKKNGICQSDIYVNISMRSDEIVEEKRR